MSLTGIAFLLVFLAALGLAAFRHPIWGLYLYIALVYIHPPSRWWGADLPDIRWSLITALVTVVATLMRSDIRAPEFLRTPMVKTWMIFLVWMWLTTIWSINLDEQIIGAVLFTKYLAMWFLFFYLVQDVRTLKNVLLAHIAGCFWLGFLAWEAGGGPGRLEGVGGPGLDEANVMAMHLGTGAAVAGMFVLMYKDWTRYLAILAAPFMMNTIILSGSRGAFLSLAVTGLVMYFYKPKKFRLAFIFAGLIGICSFLYLADLKFLERIGTIAAIEDGSEAMDTSSQSRFVIIAAQWQMALAHPFGSGHRGTAYLSRDYMDEQWLSQDGTRGSHNTLMTVLVDQGFPGFILYTILLFQLYGCFKRIKWYCLTYNLPEPHGLATGLFGIAAMVLTAGIFVNYQKVEVMFWAMALACALENILQRQYGQYRKAKPQAVETTPNRSNTVRPAID